MTDMPAAAGSGRAPGGAEPGRIHRHDLMAALNRGSPEAGHDYLGACRHRQDVAVARVGGPSWSGWPYRLHDRTAGPARHAALLAHHAGRGPGRGRHRRRRNAAAAGDTRLERQPPEVQSLLLRTSVLDRVNGELADLLTGATGSERILLDLEDANAFVVSLDPGRTWFRYHRMFGGLLRLELRRTMPADIAGLHQLAARWLAARGQAADAIGHLQAAGDWDEAASMLTDHALSLTLDGQAGTSTASSSRQGLFCARAKARRAPISRSAAT